MKMLLDKENMKIVEKKLKEYGTSAGDIRIKAIKEEKAIVICGPTCTGKTGMAINLAKILGTDIISLDSMQVFTGMDIGTDKFDTAKLGIRQYMVDVFAPDHRVTVVEFREVCRELIDSDFYKKGKIPLMAGGSGLYVRAVIDDLDFVSGDNLGQDLDLRESLEKDIKKNGTRNAYERLNEIDPEYAEKIGESDAKRIIRALEVYNITGIPFSRFQNKWEERKSIYNCTMIGLRKEKKDIESCIVRRVEKMLERGLVDEVKELIKKGYKDSNSLRQAVGYKEVIEYLDNKGKSGVEYLRPMIIKNTKKLVKKQRTWFRADPRIKWITVDNCDNMLNSIIEALKILWRDL